MVYQKPRINLPSPFTRTSPAWAGTPGHQPKVLIPGGGHLNTAEFISADASQITTTAGAAIGATTVVVSALTSTIPSGSILDFTGSGKFAKLTASAVVGATSLVVEALPQALIGGDIAYYSSTNRKAVISGTLVGRTFAERDAGIGYGMADVATPDGEIYLLYFDVADANIDNEAELYMHGNVVYENLLPGWTALGAAIKSYIRSNYTCITGVV